MDKTTDQASFQKVGKNPGAGSIYYQNRQKANEHILAMPWHVNFYVSFLPSLILFELHGFKFDYVNLSKILG